MARKKTNPEEVIEEVKVTEEVKKPKKTEEKPVKKYGTVAVN